jgi:hypothetical protein
VGLQPRNITGGHYLVDVVCFSLPGFSLVMGFCKDYPSLLRLPKATLSHRSFSSPAKVGAAFPWTVNPTGEEWELTRELRRFKMV